MIFNFLLKQASSTSAKFQSARPMGTARLFTQYYSISFPTYSSSSTWFFTCRPCYLQLTFLIVKGDPIHPSDTPPTPKFAVFQQVREAAKFPEWEIKEPDFQLISWEFPPDLQLPDTKQNFPSRRTKEASQLIPHQLGVSFWWLWVECACEYT